MADSHMNVRVEWAKDEEGVVRSARFCVYMTMIRIEKRKEQVMGEDAERSPHGQEVHVEPFTDTWFACYTSGLNHFPSLDHLSVRFSICTRCRC